MSYIISATTYSRCLSAPPSFAPSVEGVDYHYDNIADQGEDHGYREPLEEELPRSAEVQEVGLCWVFLMGVFLRERFPSRSKTCQ